MKRIFLAVLLFAFPVFSQEKSEPKAEEKAAVSVSVSREHQTAITALQKDLELAQAKLEAAQRQVENVQLRAALLFAECEKATPAGYRFDRPTMQYNKIEAPNEKPKGEAKPK